MCTFFSNIGYWKYNCLQNLGNTSFCCLFPIVESMLIMFGQVHLNLYHITYVCITTFNIFVIRWFSIKILRSSNWTKLDPNLFGQNLLQQCYQHVLFCHWRKKGVLMECSSVHSRWSVFCFVLFKLNFNGKNKKQNKQTGLEEKGVWMECNSA